MIEYGTTNLEEIRSYHFKPEPHTVKFVDNEEWYCIRKNGKLVTVMSVIARGKGKYIGEVFTVQEERNNGYMTALINHVVKEVYPMHDFTVHCLASSINCFKRAGFEQYNIRYFKHGTQYYMRYVHG